MGKKSVNVLAVAVLALTLALAGPAAAMEKKHGAKGGHGSMKAGGHVFGPGWKETLEEDQKLKIDKMHLALKKKMVVLKAEKKVKEAELGLLVTSAKPDMNAINKKIDEIVEIKRALMKMKYAHMVEMRSVLTPDQRISFDMGVLSSRGKGGHRGRHGKR